MEESREYNLKYVWSISLVAAMGGLLFGYDWVVIGGAKPFYEEYFGLTTSFQIGWAMSSALVGCLIGSVISGIVSDRYGRKRLLLLSAVLFTVSAIGTALANGFDMFVWFRLLGGIGIGLASNLSPIYIAEVSPAPVRGRFVSVNQLTIVIGVLAAQFVNWLIAEPVPETATASQILQSWNGQFGWRWMFAVETVPAVFFFLLMLFVPESPRWLVKNGRDKAASKILERVGGKENASRGLQEIRASLVDEIEKVNFRELLEPNMVKILSLGIFLAVFQQW
jgi:SP family sugar porter-like MFS transporter